MIRRPIVVGQGALIEGDFAGMAADDVAPRDSIVSLVDGVCMVTREPIDRLQQIIAQSWYWIGGFCAPSDTTTNSLVLPTATQCKLQAGSDDRAHWIAGRRRIARGTARRRSATLRPSTIPTAWAPLQIRNAE
ncbi:MAG: hypothetical protein WDN04_16715 [Rhodospirillales bacterium]